MSQEDILVSDSEREKSIMRLRHATTEGRLTLEEFSQRMDSILSARTRGELDALIRDIPDSMAAYPAVNRSIPTHWSVAIMSETKRTTRWRVDETTNAVAVMGSCKLDLRKATLASGELVINAFAVMGEIKVIVPAGTQVELEGFAIMGSKECRVDDENIYPDSPLIRVRGYAVMGGVVVVSDDPTWYERTADRIGDFTNHMERRRRELDDRYQRKLRKLEERRMRHSSRHRDW